MAPTHTGFRTFLVVWLGQLVSIIGSGLTDFALGLYIYQQTRSVTQFALILFFRTLPVIALSPVAGALVDRWPKRTVMLCSDLVGGLCSLALALLFFSGQLQLWHVCLGAAITAIANTFRVPAYLTATSALIPKKQLGRANGLVQMAQAIAEICVPLMAGVLVAVIQVSGILLVDVASFGVSILTLLMVRLPVIAAPVHDPRPGNRLVQEIKEGAVYILRQPTLIVLLCFFAAISFESGIISVLIQPLILAFAPPQVLGTILTAGGGGIMLGSILLSVWGGPARKIHGVLSFAFLFGLGILLIGLRPSPVLVGIGVVGAHFCIPFVNGCNQAIWQSRVNLALQGRVFAFRQMVVNAAQLLAVVLIGPLTERFFVPLLVEKGPLAGSLGQVIGVGAGRGIGFIFLLTGSLIVLTAGIGWLFPPLRTIEMEGQPLSPDLAATGSHAAPSPAPGVHSPEYLHHDTGSR